MSCCDLYIVLWEVSTSTVTIREICFNVINTMKSRRSISRVNMVLGSKVRKLSPPPSSEAEVMSVTAKQCSTSPLAFQPAESALVSSSVSRSPVVNIFWIFFGGGVLFDKRRGCLLKRLLYRGCTYVLSPQRVLSASLGCPNMCRCGNSG
jgi:hypothetical protein